MEQNEILQKLVDEMQKFRELLFGNGAVGLCEKVRVLEKAKKLVFKLPNIIQIGLNIVLTGLLIFFIIKKKGG